MGGFTAHNNPKILLSRTHVNIVNRETGIRDQRSGSVNLRVRCLSSVESRRSPLTTFYLSTHVYLSTCTLLPAYLHASIIFRHFLSLLLLEFDYPGKHIRVAQPQDFRC